MLRLLGFAIKTTQLCCHGDLTSTGYHMPQKGIQLLRVGLLHYSNARSKVKQITLLVAAAIIL